MSAVNGHKPHEPIYWCAYLAAAIADALLHWDHAQATLRNALGQFTKSRACDQELRTILRNTKGE